MKINLTELAEATSLLLRAAEAANKVVTGFVALNSIYVEAKALFPKD